MAGKGSWGAGSGYQRRLAMGALLTFASPDGSLSDGERRILAWAGRELAFKGLPDWDLAEAVQGIVSTACRRELIRTIVLLLEARGGSMAEDRAALAFLTRAWDLPTPELAPPAAAEAPPRPGALAAARRRALDDRTEAVAAALRWRRERWSAVVAMVAMTWCFSTLLLSLPFLLAAALPAQREPFMLVDLDPATKIVWAMGIFLLSPLTAGLVLGLRGAVEREARRGGFLAWAIAGAAFGVFAALASGAHPTATAAGVGLGLFGLLGLASAAMGHIGVLVTRWFRPDRPK